MMRRYLTGTNPRRCLINGLMPEGWPGSASLAKRQAAERSTATCSHPGSVRLRRAASVEASEPYSPQGTQCKTPDRSLKDEYYSKHANAILPCRCAPLLQYQRIKHPSFGSGPRLRVTTPKTPLRLSPRTKLASIPFCAHQRKSLGLLDRHLLLQVP